jgi:DNA-directed RNA polymerase
MLAASEALEWEQRQRQDKAKRRSEDARATNQRRLREFGKESALPYGQKIYAVIVDAVADSLAASFEEFVLNPGKARQHASAIPFFDNFSSVHHIAAVAVTAAIDQMSRRQRYPTFLQHLGLAIERETRLIKLGKRSPMEMRRLMRGGISRRTISSRKVMRALNCPVVEWNDMTRLQVGAFLAQPIFDTELLTTILVRKGKTTPRLVVPTKQAEGFIKSCRPKAYRINQLSMLVPPRDWQPDLYGGGQLDNQEPFVKPVLYDASEDCALAHYLAADLSMQIRGLNFLQSHRLRVSGEIVAAQRPAWDNGIEGLWPCSRNPPEVPDRLGDDPSPFELKARNNAAAAAHRDRETNRHKRIKIERSLQIAEEVASREIWQSWYADFRGRYYTSNACGSTQGPGYEKAQLSFAEQLPVNDEAFEWLLKAAAGHHGLSRDTWEARLSWGTKNIDQMIAAADDPLGKLELWRSAKDPWEYLQMCFGVRDARATGKTGVPIRFDQTTSGPGILAALTRNAEIGKLCNLYGNDPHDLYTIVAEACTAALTKDLELGDEKRRALAELWLKRGIDRALVKGPVLKVPYGATWMAVADGLVDAMEQHIGHVPLEEYIFRVSIPSKYMASIVWTEMKAVMTPVLEVKAWLRDACKRVLSQQLPMEWSSPSGWPMRAAEREPTKRRVMTLLYGKKVGATIADQPMDSPLSSSQSNRGLVANTIHALDSALVHKVLYRAVDISMPVMPTHDCFACHPANAGRLHKMLLHEFGNMYRMPVLEQMKAEIEDRTGVQLKPVPNHGTLDPMAIGSNPYLFG